MPLITGSLYKLLRRFRKGEEGATAVEFALILPALLLILFGIVEFSLIMLLHNMMESATINTSRLGKTGYVAAHSSRLETLREAVVERTKTLIDPDLITITSRSYGTFEQVGKPEPWNDFNNNGVAEPGEFTDINGNGVYDADMGLAGFGGADDVVVYNVTYPWRVRTPVISRFFNDGVHVVSAVAVVKNEPY